jgi:hypothetical protein
VRLTNKYMAGAAALVTAIGVATLPASEGSATTVAPVHGTVEVWVNPSNGGGGPSVMPGSRNRRTRTGKLSTAPMPVTRATGCWS